MSQLLMMCRISLVAIILIGCSSDDDDDDVLLDGTLQIVNAIPDSPPLTITLIDDGAADDDDEETIIGVISFQAATAVFTLEQRDYEINITYVDPETGSDENFVADIDVDITRDKVNTLILSGTFANPSDMLLEKTFGDIDDNDDDEFELQIVNLSTGTSLDVYFLENGESLNSPTATLSFGDSSTPVALEEEDYRLQVTEIGSDSVLYDSGSFDVPDRVRRTVVINDNVGPDAATRSAFVVTEGGTTVYPNEVARAGLRIINVIADETSAAIEVTDSATLLVIEAVTLDFTDITDFLTVEPNFISVTLDISSLPGETFDSTVSLNEDAYFTIITAGSAEEDEDGDNTIAIRAASTEQRAIATTANIQFVNALTETDLTDFDRVDFYALEIGDSLSDSAPTFSQIEFLEGSNTALPATAFDFVVTTAGTQSILAGPTRLNLEGATSLFVIAVEASGGGKPNQIIVHTTQ